MTVRRDWGATNEKPTLEGMADAVGTAYIEGFAHGFMLRTDTTYEEFCQKHADEMKAALLAEGAKPFIAVRV